MANAWDSYGNSDLESVKAADKVEMFKVKSGKINRISFSLIHPETKKVIIAPVQYWDGKTDEGKWIGIRMSDTDNQELATKLTKKFGQPKTRWVSVIVEYETNKDGKCFKPFQATIKGVKFGKKDVQTLKTINSSVPLSNVDLYVSTDNETMQAKNFTLVLSKDGSAHKSLFRDNQVHIDDSEDGEIWAAKDIIQESWDMLEDVKNSVAWARDEDSILELIGEAPKRARQDDDDDFDSDDEDEFESDESVTSDDIDEEDEPKVKTEPSKKKKDDIDEDIDF